MAASSAGSWGCSTTMVWVPHVETLQLVFVGDKLVLENKYSEEKHVVPAGSKLSFGPTGWAKLESGGKKTWAKDLSLIHI
eukprot:3942706-Prorocentrum_lima.AAC.1